MANTEIKVTKYRCNYLTEKNIFPVTITLIEIVIEFLSNYLLRSVNVSKYFPYSKTVIDYLSKYMVSYNFKTLNIKLLV